MSNFSFISQLIRGKWLLEPSVAVGYMPIAQRLLQGDFALDNTEQNNPFSFLAMDGEPLPSQHSEDLPSSSIAVLNIEGALLYEDGECGEMGMFSMAERIRSLRDNENISALLLKINSPGGTVTGTEELANALLSFKTKKPVVAYVRGMAASAAYWLASTADMVIAGNQTVSIGSIGVMLSFADMQKALEKQGVEFHMIRASQSYDKNEAFQQAREGNYEPIISEELDPTAALFIQAMQTNRPQITQQGDEPYTGKTYLAETAVKFGLIDAIGDYDFALDTLQNLITEMSEKKTTVFDALAGVFGSKKEEVEANAAALVEEGNAFKAEIAQLKTANAALDAKHKAEASSRQAAEEKANEFEAKISALEEEVATLTTLLEKTPEGVSVANINVSTDVVESTDKKYKFGSKGVSYNDRAWSEINKFKGDN